MHHLPHVHTVVWAKLAIVLLTVKFRNCFIMMIYSYTTDFVSKIDSAISKKVRSVTQYYKNIL